MRCGVDYMLINSGPVANRVLKYCLTKRKIYILKLMKYICAHQPDVNDHRKGQNARSARE